MHSKILEETADGISGQENISMLILAGRNSIQTLAACVEHSAHFGDDFLGRCVGEAEILVDLNLMLILAGVCDNLDLAVKAGEGDIDTAGIADVCLLLVDENLIGVYAGILFRLDFLHSLHQFYEFSGKIAGSISHVGACLGIRWLCNRVPWVLHKLCGEQRLVNFLLHFFAGNALVDLFFCASAEFSILTVDKDGQKRMSYFFRAAHVELLTDEKCLAGFGLLFADQKVAGFACF